MGTKYSQQSASGYNASPPPDDGSETEANKTKWEHVKDKLGDPIKNLADAIDSALRTHFDEGPITKSVNYTTTDADFGKVIEASSGITVTLRAAGSAGAGYRVTVKSADDAGVTVDVASSGTIDGESSTLVGGRDVATFMVNQASGEYMEITPGRSNVADIKGYGGTSEPAGWKFCNGQALSRTTFASLFAEIGETYGNGDGSTTFNVPDSRDRSLLGENTMGASDAGRVSTTSTGLGDSGGADDHTLTTDEMPSHTHSDGIPATWNDTSNGPNRVLTSNGTSNTHSFGITTNSTGGGSAHNNMHPFLVVNFIIKT